MWGFEFWQKIPGNPRNCCTKLDYDRFCREHVAEIEAVGYFKAQSDSKYRLEYSELRYMDVPVRFDSKDEIIDWLLYESDFMKRAGGPDIGSREELELWLEAIFAPEKP